MGWFLCIDKNPGTFFTCILYKETMYNESNIKSHSDSSISSHHTQHVQPLTLKPADLNCQGKQETKTGTLIFASPAIEEMNA